MVPTSAARLAWRLFVGWLPLAGAVSVAPGAASPAPSPAAAPTQALRRVPDGTALFLDGLEIGNHCRWSAAVPPEAGSCSDLVQNGCETDTDCGGRSCPGCGFGLDCDQGSDCQSGICYLGQCDIAYPLSVTHTGGGAVTSSPAGIDCGGTCSALFDAGTEVTLTATPAGDALFLGWTGACAGSDPCTLTIDQAAAVGAHFGHSLEVTRVGTGTVISTPPGIDCGVTCSGTFEHGTAVTLQARTTNGSASFFSGWTGACVGAFRDCAFTITGALDATATFSALTYNLAFVSSTTFATNLGSAGAYDTQCNNLATAAGINNAAGNAYVAWISSATSTATSRLATTGGWTLLDGTPFSSSKAALITNRQILHPIDLDETGTPQSSRVVLTGTLPDGTVSTAETCTNWTGAGNVACGDTAGGPVAWTRLNAQTCASSSRRIYCLMKTQSAILTPPVHPGKKIWISSSAFLPIGGSPALVCDAEQTSSQALITNNNVPASPFLTSGADYVRMDGQFVGTGAQLIAAGPLATGIWQHHDGTYLGTLETYAWTGHNGDLNAPGNESGTCNGWANPTLYIGGAGMIAVNDARWWDSGFHPCNSPNRFLICVEP